MSGAAPTEDVVTLDVRDHLATVAFNRPEVLNACNLEVLQRLVEVFAEIDERDDIWCVVLKGNGRAFCAGADQKERLSLTADDLRRRRRIAPAAFSAMRLCRHPVIGQVHGFAFGGGVEMALACDIVVAAEDTMFGMVETLRGSIPAGGGTQVLPRLAGMARAKELVFTGRRFSAREAYGWGIVSYCVPLDDLEETVRALVDEILSASPIANTQAKLAMNLAWDLDVANGILAEAALYERAMNSKDRLTALKAYHGGAKPVFEGL